MSAQSYNSTTYDSFTTLTDKTGISPGFPLRDSSDYTRMIKERAVYREQKLVEPVSPLVSQSNAYNLSYVMGRVECAGCTGGRLMYSRVLGS
jgi:hypothetical protein